MKKVFFVLIVFMTALSSMATPATNAVTHVQKTIAITAAPNMELPPAICATNDDNPQAMNMNYNKRDANLTAMQPATTITTVTATGWGMKDAQATSLISRDNSDVNATANSNNFSPGNSAAVTKSKSFSVSSKSGTNQCPSGCECSMCTTDNGGETSAFVMNIT